MFNEEKCIWCETEKSHYNDLGTVCSKSCLDELRKNCS